VPPGPQPATARAPHGQAAATPGAAALESEIDRAAALFRAGRPAACLRLVRSVRRRASRLAPDPAALTVVARSLVTEAAPLFDVSGDLAAALALLDRAERLAREVGSAGLAARVAGQRALVTLRSGDTRDALALFDVAVSLIEAADPRDKARILMNRGVLHLELADLERAESDLTRSVDFAHAADDPRLAAMAQHNLGYVDFLAGRIPSAIAAFERAARTLPGGAHPTMQIDHARALREAGLFRDADVILAQSGLRLRRERIFQDLAETELVRAECALEEEDLRRARSFASSARRRFARRGNLRWVRKSELLLLRCDWASVEERNDRRASRRLLAIATRAAELASVCRDERRPDLARLAELLEAECRLRGGAEAATVPRVRAMDPLSTRLQVRKVRALAAVRRGEDRKARAEVRRGLTELASYQSGLGSLDLRTASAVHGVTLARVALDIALSRGTAADVLATVEQSRAISTQLPQVRPPADETTARLVGRLRRLEEEARELEGDPAASEEVSRLRSTAATLQREIRARAWQLEGAGSGPLPPPRPAQVRAAVRATGSTFVSFARHRGRRLAVVVTPRGARVVDLAPAGLVTDLVRRVRVDLDALALPRLAPPIATAVAASLKAGLRRLDEVLLAPLQLADRPLVLSCSGPLAVLPWTLLPSRAGLPTAVTPAAATWLRHLEGASRPPRPDLVVVAGPGLHRAEQEAADIAATWGAGALLVGDRATTASVRAALAGSDLLHVAAHGRHRADSPLFSSLRLADGQLYAYELDGNEGVPGCVTLSACEAGLATPRPGDEGLGLTHVLLHLGCRSVVAGVARVRDDVAADTMTRVHAGMAAGLDSASALAQAQLAADADVTPAPFVCFGGTW
jgi:tetratricopeptide (TPR) repeat protein